MKHRKYARRDAIKNYFPLPNEIFLLGLSAGEIAVYAYLMFCENRKTYTCYPSYKTIGNAVKMSKNTVRKHVALLEEKQLIRTEHTNVFTKEGLKRNGNLLYTICPIQEALDYKYEQQFAQVDLKLAQQEAANKLAAFDRKHGYEPVCEGFPKGTSDVPPAGETAVTGAVSGAFSAGESNKPTVEVQAG